MGKRDPSPRWAPPVRGDRIRLLYETDARGIHDEDLIDEIGFALYARCESLLESLAARGGRVVCLRCGRIVRRTAARVSSSEARSEVLRCGRCGWEMRWGSYYDRLVRRGLTGCDEENMYAEFTRSFPKAQAAREKMVLIDRLIHAFHHSAVHGFGAPSAGNLIEGRPQQVIALLDELTYRKGSTAGTQERARRWRGHLRRQ